jgi:hypothetical protein
MTAGAGHNTARVLTLALIWGHKFQIWSSLFRQLIFKVFLQKKQLTGA